MSEILSWIIASGYIILLIIIAVIDWRLHIIPDAVIYPSLAFVVALAVFYSEISLMSTITGLAIGGGLYFLVFRLVPGKIGQGDIKFMALAGGMVGYPGLFWVMAISWIAALLFIAVKKRQGEIPFGPFISVASAAIILWRCFYAEC